jgi:hypothetical protein
VTGTQQRLTDPGREAGIPQSGALPAGRGQVADLGPRLEAAQFSARMAAAEAAYAAAEKATRITVNPPEPTPVPVLIAQIRDEGDPDFGDKLAAALGYMRERGFDVPGLSCPSYPPGPPSRAERKRALTVLPGGAR